MLIFRAVARWALGAAVAVGWGLVSWADAPKDDCADCPESRRTGGEFDAIPFAKMDLNRVTSGNRSVRKCLSTEGKTLTLGGQTYTCGVGVHAPSRFDVVTDGNAYAFSSVVGIDREVSGQGSVEFLVYGDGKVIARSGVMRKKDGGKLLYADLTGVRFVELVVTDAGDGMACDHADWCNAIFRFKKGCTPGDIGKYTTQLGRLTPPTPKAPRINTPAVYGVRPGHEIVYRLPVTGESPEVEVEVEKRGGGEDLRLEGRVLRGRIAKAGEYPIRIRAKNAFGTDEKTMVVKVGDAFCLTPPLGWNSWNFVNERVSDKIVREQAEAMVASGLADHGYQYVNIDDFWQRNNGKRGQGKPELNGPERTEDGTILPNARFPDMKALADFIHAKGLKAGLYSSPGPRTCGGCTGSYGFEEKDARTWAAWGYDYVKYDWCSYGGVKYEGTWEAKMRHPYRVMGEILKKSERDIVFSLCQYGMGNVSAWGASVGGQCWRTVGDVWDSWSLVAAAIDHQAYLGRYSSPGAWNDPDMLVLKPTVKETGITPNEMYSHITIWAMSAAPLLIGCDMRRLDDFVRGLLENDEVIAIDQDALGRGAERAGCEETVEIWTRPLANGDSAVALYNPSLIDRTVTVDLAACGIPKTAAVRDLWRQQDLPRLSDGRLTATVYGHASNLYRISK